MPTPNRIIRPGVPSFEAFTMTCSACHCEFEVPELGNVRIQTSDDVGQSHRVDHVVTKCPACHNWVTVPSDVEKVLKQIIEYHRLKK